MVICCQKSCHILLIKTQNSTIRQILDMRWYARNFQVYKEIDIPSLNYFIEHVNLNFHLVLVNIDNRVLNTNANYDLNNPVNRKHLKTGLQLNTFL